MSTSLLYHGFGIVGYRHVRTLFKAGEIVFGIVQGALPQRCPRGKSLHVWKRGTVTRIFGTLSLGLKPVFVELPIQRVECLRCRAARQVDTKLADVRRTCAKSFKRHVLELSNGMTIKDVADRLGVGWDLVMDIQKRNYKT